MAFNVNDFRSQLTRDGARPNLFQVTMNLPPFAGQFTAAGNKLQFMAKSAQLPGSTIGIVPVYYFGRELKFAGNRTFSDWTLTIINDEDFIIRSAIEAWMNSINSHVGNLRNTAAENNSQYQINATVTQYNKDGSYGNGVYQFNGMFPVDLSPIDLDWGSNDSIEEYTATFAYQYWTNVASTDIDSTAIISG